MKDFPSMTYFNPLSPHGERPCSGFCSRPPLDFNPLSPHGERQNVVLVLYFTQNFNPLSPHGERLLKKIKKSIDIKFQSTLPAWGETGKGFNRNGSQLISIHSPRMGRDVETVNRCACNGISIHSPRMGRDVSRCVYCTHNDHFNPLSPHGERLRFLGMRFTLFVISIHSPRMGRDKYQSNAIYKNIKISIHSPRMGRDANLRIYSHPFNHFNPLSPHGERQSAIYNS